MGLREKMPNETFYHIYTESPLPLIAYIKDPWRFPWSDVTHREGGMLVGFTWNSQAEHEACAEWVKERLSDSFSIEVLCDTPELTAWFQSQGLQAEFVNENCWHDENLFFIDECPKKYDLIYVAAATRYKHLELFAKMNPSWKIAWVCGRIEDRQIFDRTSNLSNVTVFGGGKMIPRQDVCRLMNESKVGLCLSIQEASMRAACEYRLCGLPIVNVRTTGGKYSPSSCGREVLLGDAFVFTADTIDKVNAATENALSVANEIALDARRVIRFEYLSLRGPHQQRFVEALNQIVSREGLPSYTVKTATCGHFNLKWDSLNRYL